MKKIMIDLRVNIIMDLSQRAIYNFLISSINFSSPNTSKIIIFGISPGQYGRYQFLPIYIYIINIKAKNSDSESYIIDDKIYIYLRKNHYER